MITLLSETWIINCIRMDNIQLSSIEDFIEIEAYFFSFREWVQFTGEKSYNGVILDTSICSE